MANEDDQLDELDELPESPEGEEDKTDWKAEAHKRQGSAKRYKSQAQKLKDELAQERAKSAALAKNDSKPDKTEFDYAELAYLTSKGVSDEEVSFVWDQVKATGKSLKELLGTKWFQAELKERRDDAAAKEATPTGTKRSTTPARDSVDYWINKGELPPADQVKLRQQVVNRKIELAKGKSQFSDTPVVK